MLLRIMPVRVSYSNPMRFGGLNASGGETNDAPSYLRMVNGWLATRNLRPPCAWFPSVRSGAVDMRVFLAAEQRHLRNREYTYSLRRAMPSGTR